MTAEHNKLNSTTPIASNVCWELTSRCNDACKFCYRQMIKEQLSREEADQVLDNLVQSGIKKITFTGGEALLYPHTWHLIRRAHEKGVVTSLITNGILLTAEDLKKYAPYLNWVTFSLDGPDTETNRLMTRNDGHFQRIVGWIRHLNETYPHIKIKINTVVGAPNINRITEMIPLINGFKIERWKLLHFFPVRGIAQKNARHFTVTDEAYIAVADQLKRLGEKLTNCRLSIEGHQELAQAYLSVGSDGTLRIDEQAIVSLIEGSLTAEMLEDSSFSKHLHQKRVEWLFNKKSA